MPTVRVVVSGRVQGVSFRAYTRAAATELGVGGWVRNLRDGRVELVATGPRDAVDALIAWCWDGSPAARVEGLDVEDLPDQPFDEFRIARSV